MSEMRLPLPTLLTRMTRELRRVETRLTNLEDAIGEIVLDRRHHGRPASKNCRRSIGPVRRSPGSRISLSTSLRGFA